MISPFREVKEIIYPVGAIKSHGIRPWRLIKPTRYIIFYSSLNCEINYILFLSEQAELSNELRGYGPFTVFVPSDAAFSTVSPRYIQDIMENKDAAKGESKKYTQQQNT